MVVLIIGILAAIAVPQYQKAVEKSRTAEALLLIKAISDAQDRYLLQTGSYATNMDDLDIAISGAASDQQAGRKLTANFDVGVTTNWKAVAQRLPRMKKYAIIVRNNNNRKFCLTYDDNNYKSVCTALGGTEVDISECAGASSAQKCYEIK